MTTRLAATACWLALLLTPAMAGSVEVEVGADADMSGYSTYRWERGTPAADDWVQLMIVDAVEDQLDRRGLKRVDEGGDLLVTTVAVAESVTGTTVDPGYWGGGADFGMPTVDIADYRKGVLYVTLKDAGDESTVWRASGKARMKVSQREQYRSKVNSLIKKIFRNYPREKK